MNLAQRTMSGTKWSAVSRFGRQGVGFVITAILARMLSPDAYGLLGMATVVVGFINIIEDLGTSSAIIRQEELTERLKSSLFWINVAFGMVSTVVVIVIAPWVAGVYREPRVIPILRILSVSFTISGVRIVHQALLVRQMEFAELARVELVSTAIAGLGGIGMATAGMGVWSLVGQTLCTSMVTTILLWVRKSWRPRFVLNWADLRSVAPYSLNLSGFNILNYFVRNADNLLIGRYLGSTSLGYYSLAYRLMLYPLHSVSGVLGRVLFPAFAKIQDDNVRFRRNYLRVCAAISVIAFPMMLGLLVTAEPLVGTVLGQQWMTVVTLLMVLAPVGLSQSVSTTVGHIYTAKGRTDWMFRWGIISGLVTVVFLVVGLQWGVVGVATAYAVRSLLLVYPSYAIPLRLIGLPVSDLARMLWPILKTSLVMAAVVALWRLILAIMAIGNSFVVLVSSVLLGLSMYGWLLLRHRPPILQDVLQSLQIGSMPWLSLLAARMEED